MENEHTNKMIEAFVNKEDKTLWYQLSFAKFNINGIDSIKWNWSWWAFGGGFLFLLYRKQYLASFALFFLSMTVGMIPFMGLILAILAGGFSSYFVYKGYKSKLQSIESTIADEEVQIDTMKQVGGYHQWVIYLYIICVVFALIGFITFFSASALMMP